MSVEIQVDDKKNAAQEKLRGLIGEEVKSQLSPMRWSSRAAIGVSCAGFVLFGFALIKMPETTTVEIQSKPAIQSLSTRLDVGSRLYAESPLEFLVGVNTALVIYGNEKIDDNEIRLALDLFSKRRDHDIGEPLGTILNEASGKPLDPRANIKAFELALKYLQGKGSDKHLGITVDEESPLEQTLMIRQERLIQQMNAVLIAREDREKLVKQLGELNRIFAEMESQIVIEAALQENGYKSTGDRIMRRIDPKQA